MAGGHVYRHGGQCAQPAETPELHCLVSLPGGAIGFAKAGSGAHDAPVMPRLQRKSFSAPDQVRSCPNGRIDVVLLDDIPFGRFVFQRKTPSE